MSRVVLSDGGELFGGFLRGTTTAATLDADLVTAPVVSEDTLKFIPTQTLIAADSNQTYPAAAVYGGAVARGPLTANRTDTLPTGTQLDAARDNGVTSFFFSVSNLAPSAHKITLQGNTGNTFQDNALSGEVIADEVGVFLCIRISANTWRTIRIDT